ncbi:hypothetical protein NKOR_03950 [Candidatus Nitrosopumilus koreensis AR1]|uniref:Uncharacterized protein n=1 Tax=Candidatus Nitrosopumilus koreensis AR1 TaxID=1229908 RepID=K0B6S8_9ARCH|nr:MULTISPECIES: hypothetical protein [Nitrosopumilus]AFS80680.1 hypothetical protein NKOR_03950 [Candidatus Nitrosopumilus koreensis AR1]
MSERKERSLFWYVLPLFFSMPGALIAYFILRKDDPSKAKNCLLIGVVLLAFYAAYYVVFEIMLRMYEFS